MQSLLAIPGVQSVCITDSTGGLQECAGPGQPPDPAITVLAQATFTAAAELGRRAGAGECLDLLQQHEDAVLYLRGLPWQRVLLVRCLPSVDPAALRHAAARIGTTTSAPGHPAPPPPPVLDLGSALHAMPAW
jgi:hypothetical protein